MVRPDGRILDAKEERKSETKKETKQLDQERQQVLHMEKDVNRPTVRGADQLTAHARTHGKGENRSQPKKPLIRVV